MNDIGCFDSIPNAKMGQVTKMLETLKVLGGVSDKAGIAFGMGVKEKSIANPILAGSLLGLVKVIDKEVELTKRGEDFLDANEETRIEIINGILSTHEPFTTLLRALAQGPLRREDVIKFVKAKMVSARTWKESTEKEMLKVIKNWCEFGKLFRYDSESDTFVKV